MNDLDAHADRVAEIRHSTQPILDGALTGALCGAFIPGVVVVGGLFLSVLEGGAGGLLTLLLPLFGAPIGAALGALVGLIDAPGRLAVALARRETPVALLVMSQFSGVLVGGPWFGVTGALAGIGTLAGTTLAYGQRIEDEALLAAVLIGWFYGMILGIPAALLHATSRGLCVAYDSPRYVPALAGGATALGVSAWIIWIYVVLAGITMLIAAIGRAF